jgi:hypothetical protein
MPCLGSLVAEGQFAPATLRSFAGLLRDTGNDHPVRYSTRRRPNRLAKRGSRCPRNGTLHAAERDAMDYGTVLMLVGLFLFCCSRPIAEALYGPK